MWVMNMHHKRLLSTEIEYWRRASGMSSTVGVGNNRSGGQGCSHIRTEKIRFILYVHSENGNRQNPKRIDRITTRGTKAQ